MDQRYYNKFAVAAVRGGLKRTCQTNTLRSELMTKDLDELNEKECDEILSVASKANIKLYHFKESHNNLPRVKMVLGVLKGLYFESLIDIGSGRGVFLIPFMQNFPHIKVKSVDILDKRIEMLNDIKNGGISNLEVYKEDICNQPFPDKSIDIVTMLEVLEHIPDVKKAILAAVRIAKSYVIITVPSKEDDNPEHIHLLTKDKLTEYFNTAGVTKLNFNSVPGHLFMIAKIG